VTTVRTIFRAVAIAEALSWALLLSAMFCKWVLKSEPFGLHEGGVPVAGPIHGGIFVAYVLSCIAAAVVFKWEARTTLLALGSSIPPFFTYWFEVVADRKGLLGAGQRSGATSAP
jgi:integral membrane protein